MVGEANTSVPLSLMPPRRYGGDTCESLLVLHTYALIKHWNSGEDIPCAKPHRLINSLCSSLPTADITAKLRYPCTSQSQTRLTLVAHWCFCGPHMQVN